MWRRAVFECIEHAGKAGLDIGSGITGYGKGPVHDLAAVIADRAGGQLDAIANDVVLMGDDIERILLFERREPALRHRERVVTELDFTGLLVQLIHWKIDDPAEFEHPVLGQAEIAPDLQPSGGGERRKLLWLAANKKDCVAIAEPEFVAQSFGRLRRQVPSDRTGTFAIAEENVSKPWLALRLGPSVHLIAKGAAAAGRRRDCEDTNVGVGSDQIGEYPETRTMKMRGNVTYLDRVTQIGFVGRVALHCI